MCDVPRNRADQHPHPAQNVTDPNNNNLLVGHIYLDSDGSGTSTECTTT
jgi:hypothetical protein